MLTFNSDWRFDSPGPISDEVKRGFSNLIGRCIVNDNAKEIYEHFKQYFANAAGTTASSSSSTSWAETDMYAYLNEACQNAPLFIEAFYDACSTLPSGYPRPSVERLNRVLQEAESGWFINSPNLLRLNELDMSPVAVRELPENLDLKAQELIFASLGKAERLLSERSNRLAVQEIVWLLETVSTIFQGVETDTGTIEGKYFNKIVGDLRRFEKGKTLERVLDWITTLHGYLSSPSGGGIRHGATLATAATRPEIEPNEARLYCNLIRSYILYLLTEHRRLTGQ